MCAATRHRGKLLSHPNYKNITTEISWPCRSISHDMIWYEVQNFPYSFFLTCLDSGVQLSFRALQSCSCDVRRWLHVRVWGLQSEMRGLLWGRVGVRHLSTGNHATCSSHFIPFWPYGSSFSPTLEDLFEDFILPIQISFCYLTLIPVKIIRYLNYHLISISYLK